MMTVKDFVKSCDGKWPSTHWSVRSLIFKASLGENNFGPAFYKIGRRVLVDVDKFWECVAESKKGIREDVKAP